MTASQLNTGLDGSVALLVEELVDRLQAGGDVEAFLAAHPEHADRLRDLLPSARLLADLPASGEPDPDGDGPPLGELGDFRLIREVGRGGMGIVYEAEQVSLRRRVALKVLPFAATMDPKQLQRFRNEALAAASLHHEHIVPVHGVGCEDGVHYFAMQFIDGPTLAQVIAGLKGEQELHHGGTEDTERKQVTAPGSSPCSPCLRGKDSFRTIAALIADAADALEYAHAVGVVHRDVKPGNLLLDGAGKLWVTDFGLARFGPDAGLTMTGDLLGTLRYMAPEQAMSRHGLVDHRADVYALGATLYELLTGRPVVDAAERAEVLRKIAFEEPVAPRRLNPGIPAELETIVLKALTKEPAGRYATAQDLADDLKRFLDDRPIRGRRPTLARRTSKWAARHRAVLTSVTAVLLLSAVVLVAGLVWHNDRLRVEAANTARERDAARRQQRWAARAVDDMYTAVAQKWLDDEPHLTQLQREFLEKAVGYYEALGRDEGEGTELLLAKQRALRRAGTVLAKLGRREPAEAAFRNALAVLDRLDLPASEVIVERVELFYGLGSLLKQGDARFAEGESLVRQCVQALKQLPPEIATLPENRRLLVKAESAVGVALLMQSRFAEAEAVLREALAVARGLVSEFPREATDRRGLGGVLSNLAIVAMNCKDPGAARRLLEEAVTQQEEALRLDPRNTGARLFLRNHYSLLAGALADLNQVPEALAAARQGLAVAERLAADHPDQPKYFSVLADSHMDVGKLQMDRLGRPAEAEQSLDQALQDMEKYRAVWPEERPMLVITGLIHARLGFLKQSSGRQAEAVTQYRKALELYPGHPDSNNNLAWLLGLGFDPGPRDPAELVRLANVAIHSGLPDRANYWTTLGLAHYRAGDWAAARSALQKGMSLTEGGNGFDWLILAMAYHRSGDAAEPRRLYDRAAQWGERFKTEGEELRRLRAEAAALIGVAERPPAPDAGKAPPKE
jgi:eukaryotic-like serine/threonine-protein kinase